VSEDARGPLVRWSQRKAAARVAARGGAAPAPLKDKDSDDALQLGAAPASLQEPRAPAEADVPATPAENRKAEAPSDDVRLRLPPIEELTADSDYTPFLAKGVPEELTRAALRKLWHSDPIFGQMDGLDTYIQDFNVTDEVITAAQTDYVIGRGYSAMAPSEEVTPNAAMRSPPQAGRDSGAVEKPVDGGTDSRGQGGDTAPCGKTPQEVTDQDGPSRPEETAAAPKSTPEDRSAPKT
jgi:hypothetical protein